MATSIGVVRQVVGEVFAVAGDGTRRLLTEGDRVFVGEQLTTGAAGAIAIALSNGQELTLGRDSSMALTQQLLAGPQDAAPPAQDAAPVTPSEQDLTDVEQLQAAIAAGVDPTQEAEATAAGPGGGSGGAGGAGGGHSFVLLDAVAGSVDPQIGFPTAGINAGPEFPDLEVAGDPELVAIPPVVPPVTPVPPVAPANGVPVALPDSAELAEGEAGVSGNVLVNDLSGPDLPTRFLGWTGGQPGADVQLNTPFGLVTLHADGRYDFVLANGTPAVEALAEGEQVALTFDYSIADGNGDSSSATLTITITGRNDAPEVSVRAVDVEGGRALVSEAGLAAGSSAGDGSQVSTGSFHLADPEGLGSLTSIQIGSLTADLSTTALASLVGQTFDTAHGTVELTGYDGAGTFSFSYTLTSSTTDADGQAETDGFSVTLDDGQATASATVTIEILDDLPAAQADTATVSEGGSVGGNVVTGVATGTLADSFGADGPGANAVVGVKAGSDTATPASGGLGGAGVAGAWGTLTLSADGSYSYQSSANSVAPPGATDIFTYTIVDADGDLSTTTLTIDVANITVTTELGSGADTSVREAALNGIGSDPASADEIATGTLTAAGGVGNYSFVLAGDGQGLYGSLSIDSSGNYTYTLATPVSLPAGNNGANIQTTESFTYTVTDANGNSGTGTLVVSILDDVPSARADSAQVIEGGEVQGNLVTGTGTGSVADGFGADGPGANAVVGVKAGSDTATPASGGLGGAGVAGAWGTLILNADGSYSYQSTANSVAPPGATDTFTYTIVDADGDLSTTTLTIDVANIAVTTALGSGADTSVREAALGIGSDPASADEIASGTLTAAGGVGGYSFVLAGDGQGLYGSLSIDSSGNYTYTLATPVSLPAGNNGANIQTTESFTYTVTDANGNSGTGTLVVSIVDDVPSARADSAQVIEGAEVQGNVLSVDGIGSVADSFGADGAGANAVVGVRAAGGDTATAVTSGVGIAIAGQFGTLTLHADGSYSYQAHANAINAAVSDMFVYSIRDADGDLSTTTLTINLSDSGLEAPDDHDVKVYEQALDLSQDGQDLAAGTVTGSLPGHAGETDANNQLNATGIGPLTYALVGDGVGSYGVIHIAQDGSYTYSLTKPYDSNPAASDGAQVEQGRDHFTYQVTDANGNTATGTIWVDIVDDVPQVGSNALVQLDDDALAHGNLGGIEDVDPDTANLEGTLGHNFGADNAGSIRWLDSGAPLGFSYELDAQGSLLIKQGDTTVIRVTLDSATGAYSVEQLAALAHAAGQDENNQLFTLNYQVTDGDGDIAPTLGSLVINVDDDTPVLVEHGYGFSPVGGVVNEDALGTPHDGNNDAGEALSVHGGSGALHALVDFGADGPGVFGLKGDATALQALSEQNPHLSSGGQALHYQVVGNLLTASVQGTAAGNYAVFTLEVRADGGYTFTLLGPLDHPVHDGDEDGELLGGSDRAIDFSSLLTATDGDGDPVNAGFSNGSFVIDVEDDVPVLAGLGNHPVGGVANEDALHSPHEGNDDQGQELQVSGGPGALQAMVDFGADGPGAMGLKLDADSRLTMTDQHLTSGGMDLHYRLDGNLLTAFVSGATGAYDVFSLQVNPGGSYVFTLLGPLDHLVQDGEDGELLSASGMGIDFSGLITATDGDGDPLADSFDAGYFVIDVQDDVPLARNVTAAEPLDDEGLNGGIPGVGLGDVPGEATSIHGQLDYSAGADGAKSIELNGPAKLGTEDVTASDWDAATNTLTLSTERGAVVRVQVTDLATGAYRVELLKPILHADAQDENNFTLKIGYSLTDGDGDSASAELQVTIDDDVPTIQAGALSDDSYVTFNGSAAGYHNSYGYYLKGENGEPLSGKVLWADVKGQAPDARASLNGVHPEDVGFFIIPNGAQNGGLDDGDALSFQLVGGQWQAFLNGVALVGADGANVLFSDASLNPGGAHLQDTADPGNQNWEDQTAHADWDYNDVNVSVTWGAPLQVDESNFHEDAQRDFSGIFTVQPGADGLKSLSYGLGIANPGADTGLVDTASGEKVVLVLNAAGTAVEGRTEFGGQLVFRLSVDAGTGVVSLDQQRAIVHSTSDPDEPSGTLAADLIQLTGKVADNDGDSATSSIGIGHLLSFKDDGPTAVDDIRDLLAGAPSNSVSGNVLTNDLAGADNGKQFVQWNDSANGTAITELQRYGTLTLNPNTGDYSFTLANNDPDVLALTSTVSHSLLYTMRDQDGDISTAKLTINITGADDPVTVGGLDAEAPELTLYEANLADGSSPSPAALTQHGTFSVTAPDGLGSVTLNGQTVFSNGVFTALSISDAQGSLAITGYDPDSKTFSYSYSLTDNSLVSGAGILKQFSVLATDSNGSPDSASLDIRILDDAPTAVADQGAASEGGLLTVTAAAGVLGNDKAGADGFAAGAGVVGVRAAAGDLNTAVNGDVGQAINGLYGTLTLHGDGSYSYQAHANQITAATMDVFVYTIEDGDGDLSTTTLTIDVANITVTTALGSGADTSVREAALDGIGSDPASNDEIASGTLTAAGGVGGYSFAIAGDGQGLYGSLSIDSSGHYTYTLASPVSLPAGNNGENTQTTESFTYTVTDANGNIGTGSLVVSIVDDVPSAQADSAQLIEGGEVQGNLVTGIGTGSVADGFGADGVGASAVVGVKAGSDTVTPASGGLGGVGVAGTWGKLILNADGSYSYQSTANSVAPPGATDIFTYTIVDADGDLSTTTLTIDVANITVTTELGSNADTNVREAALDGIGSDPASADEIATGILTANGGAGGYSFSGGGSGAHGILSIDSSGNYTYTLTSPVNLPTGNNGENIQFTETFTYQVTDANGNTATGTISVDIVDDVPQLGSFVDATLPNQLGTVNGTFFVAPGADGLNSFTILGPSIAGVSYTTIQNNDGSGHFVSTTLLAESNTGEDLFDLTVRADGTYSFTLSKPDASSSTSISFAGLNSGGPIATANGGAAGWAFDGLKFTGDSPQQFTNPNDGGGSGGDYLNVSGNGFGLGSAAAVPDNRGFLYYQAGGADSLTFKANLTNNAGAAKITWAAYGGATPPTASSVPLQVGSSAITITASGNVTIDPTITFTYLVVRIDVDDAPPSAGVRVEEFSYSKTILPDDHQYAFSIVGQDGDGDLSGSSTLSVHVVAESSGDTFSLTGTAGDDVIAASSNPDLINGAESFDLVDYRDDTSGVLVNLLDGTGSQGSAANDIYISIEGALGGSGNDTLIGHIANPNYLDGGAGADTLIGGDSDDILLGGTGDDVLDGGAGQDVFKWQAGDSGQDVVSGFTLAAGADKDVLNLADLLQGVQATADSLDDFLSFSVAGGNSLISASAVANGAKVQDIELQGVDLAAHYGVTPGAGGIISAGDSATIITGMLGDGSLKVDTV
ncbi:retention module-containing protein [Pseudomonas cavernae]|nr:retention module-containing protein [Pseudomonas cavernae]